MKRYNPSTSPHLLFLKDEELCPSCENMNRKRVRIKSLTILRKTKEQSAGILSSKINELCRLIPALEKEIIWDTRKSNTARTRDTRDSAVYTFRNHSSLENVAMTEKTRGRRFQSGLMEEAATLDQDMLNEVILPTLVVQRTINGTADENEVSNQSQIFITSAGYKNTFAYEKLLQFLCESVVRPNESIVLGDTWRIKMPVYA